MSVFNKLPPTFGPLPVPTEFGPVKMNKEELLGPQLNKEVVNESNFRAKLLPNDLQRCVLHLPPNIKDLLINDPRFIVAGGFIRSVLRGEAINDVDLFVIKIDQENATGLAKNIAARLAEPCSYFYTPNAVSFKVNHGCGGKHRQGETCEPTKCQIVVRYTSPTAANVLQKFDYTHSMAAFWYDGEWKSVIYNNYYNDIGNSIIKFNPGFKGDKVLLVKRLLKFACKGWQYNIRDFAKVLEAFSLGEQLSWSEIYKLLASTNYGAY